MGNVPRQVDAQIIGVTMENAKPPPRLRMYLIEDERFRDATGAYGHEKIRADAMASSPSEIRDF